MFSLMLAPMEDYTGPAMRKLCFLNGADLTFSEMTRVEGIVRNNKATLAKIRVVDNTPLQIQLLASNEKQLEEYIKKFVPFDGFKGFNLNLCCPSKHIIKFGRGSAMVRRTEKTEKLIKIIQKENYLVSLKLNLGLNEIEKKNKVYLDCLHNTSADFYIIQAKTAIEQSNINYDYSVFVECAETRKKIIANGEINTKEKLKIVKDADCAGVMIGRNAILNPSIFNTLKGKDSKKINELIKDYKLLCEKYSEKEKYYSNFLKTLKTKSFL